MTADNPAESARVLKPLAQMHNLGDIPEYHQGSHQLIQRRFDVHHGHFQIPQIAVFVDKGAHIPKFRFGQVLRTFAEGTIAAAETVRKNLVAIPADYFAIVESRNLLRSPIKEEDPSFEIMRQHTIGEIVEKRTKCPSYLLHGI